MNKPIVELYEYEIFGHPESPYQTVKYGKLADSPVDDRTRMLSDCKRVTVQDSETDLSPDRKMSSCDPIHSIQGGNLKKYTFYDINNLYGNYTFFLSKNQEILEELNDSSKQTLIDNMNTVIELQFNYINKSLEKTPNKDLDDYKTYLEHHIYRDKSSFNELWDKSDKSALIQKINITEDSKIILMGDYHGSYHTFFRNLCRFHRYGIINLETYVINEPYKIVFLGDILDRGKYALDILNVIFKFMVVNNTDPTNPKMILNRGNHESIGISHRDGGLEEILDKLFDKSTRVRDPNPPYNLVLPPHKQLEWLQFLHSFAKLLCLLPSACILTLGDTYKFWCCHGGFLRQYIYDDIPLDDIILVTNHNLLVSDILWSDFEGGLGGDYVPNAARGPDLIKYSYSATMKFLNKNNINFIFRGHQDSIANSVYMKNSPPSFNKINESSINIDNFLYYNNTPKTFDKRVNGPIARVIADKEGYDNIFPLLTISTNTDYNRSLTSDSFVLLRFDINIGEISEFTRHSLSLINSIHTLFANNKFNKDMILLNNLNTTKELFILINNEKTLKLLHFIKNNDKYKYTGQFDELISDKEFMSFNTEIFTVFNELIEVAIYYLKKVNSLIQKLQGYNRLINNKFNDLITKLQICFKEINNIYNIIQTFITKPELHSITDIREGYEVSKNIMNDINRLIVNYNEYNN